MKRTTDAPLARCEQAIYTVQHIKNDAESSWLNTSASVVVFDRG